VQALKQVVYRCVGRNLDFGQLGASWGLRHNRNSIASGAGEVLGEIAIHRVVVEDETNGCRVLGVEELHVADGGVERRPARHGGYIVEQVSTVENTGDPREVDNDQSLDRLHLLGILLCHCHSS